MVVETKGKKAARERAMAKAMAMCILFKKDNYSAITGVLDRIEKEGAANVESDFRAACAGVLDSEEIDWLWNYLQHYDAGLAEMTDGKWPAIPEAKGLHW